MRESSTLNGVSSMFAARSVLDISADFDESLEDI